VGHPDDDPAHEREDDDRDDEHVQPEVEMLFLNRAMSARCPAASARLSSLLLA
jgi:hypothetical protein